MTWEPDMASGTTAHPPALEALFTAHYPALVRVLERLLGERARAEEIAADVFARLSRGGVAAGPVVPWLYRVAVNAGLDGLRSDARRKKREREAGVEALRTASAPNALEEMLRRDRCARVQSVLASLKPRDARLLLLSLSSSEATTFTSDGKQVHMFINRVSAANPDAQKAMAEAKQTQLQYHVQARGPTTRPKRPRKSM